MTYGFLATNSRFTASGDNVAQLGRALVLSGFATTDLSVRFRDARQGGGAYGKTAALRPFLPLLR